MKLTIDGKPVEANEGETVLACALRHDISVPHLCTHPNLPPFGACRMCVVEIEGIRGYPTSCTTPATEGMVVQTETAALQELRRGILELILLEHPSACLVCDKSEACEKYRPAATKAGRTTGCHTCNNKDICEVRVLSAQLNVSEFPVPPFYRNVPLERSDPFIDRDLNLCILCGRCVRICKKHQGWGVIDLVGRGSNCHIGEAFGRSLKDAGCRFCGSCIDVCPTGTLSDRFAKWHGHPESLTDTTCQFCDEACALRVGATSYNRVSTAHGINEGFAACVLGRFAIPEFHSGPKRLNAPKIRVGEVLREVRWQEAFERAAEILKPFTGDAFALICETTSTLEDRHIFKKFATGVMKSKHCIEIEPDERGVSRVDLPKGVKAAILIGLLLDPAQLEEIEALIVIDCYPTAASERAGLELPAAIFAEIEGTRLDGQGIARPLAKAADAPGKCRPDWEIVCEIARAMNAEGFDYESAASIAKEMGIGEAVLRIEREAAPAPALNPRLRRTHYRGHAIDELVRGLRQLPIEETAASSAAAGG